MSFASLVVHIPHVRGFSFVEELRKLCISLEAEPGPCSKAILLFLGCSSLDLSLYPLTSLIINCLNLPFGTQGRCWMRSLLPANKGQRALKSFCAHEPRRVLLGFKTKPHFTPRPALGGGWWLHAEHRIPGRLSYYLTIHQSEESHTPCSSHPKFSL